MAVKQQFHAARLANLQHLGFDIPRLYATPSDGNGATVSPKAAAIHELMPGVRGRLRALHARHATHRARSTHTA
jgi:hypothetical protein